MARKAAPPSMRLPADMDKLVTDEARRTQRSKSAVMLSLADEALKMRMFPGIGFKDQDLNRRAWVMGTGLDVWELIWIYQDFDGSIERMVENYNFTEQHVRLALAYYERFPEEIDAFIAENRRPLEEWMALYPDIPVTYITED